MQNEKYWPYICSVRSWTMTNLKIIPMAFLVDRVRYKQDPFMASSPAYLAATHIGLMLNRQTDVIVLNSPSIETAYQVLTTGKVVFEADQDSRIGYEIVLKGLYFDFKSFLNNLMNLLNY